MGLPYNKMSIFKAVMYELNSLYWIRSCIKAHDDLRYIYISD